MNLSVPEFLSEVRSDHRVEPGALGGTGVLEALGHPVLVSLFLSSVSVMNAWEGKMCNREEEREGTVIYRSGSTSPRQSTEPHVSCDPLPSVAPSK